LKDNYFELTITPSENLELVEAYVSDIFDYAIEETDDSLIIRTEEDPTFIVEALTAWLGEMNELNGTALSFKSSLEIKENKDWIKEYQLSISPVECGKYYVRASWHEPKEGVENLLIDPALAFGSGHHPSTKNILGCVGEYITTGMKCLDVGCGSGILAIAAAKSGALVDICDTDGLAVGSALDNFVLNSVECNNSWEGSVSGASDLYDGVFANIVADVIVMLAKQLKSKTKEGGLLFVSGIVESRLDDVLKKFSDMKQEKIIHDDGWVTIVYRK
jgi:ribosomal protein L11 methyltransferase